ncbi:hypothetical protein ABZ318_37945 [Streptomyces sp. NPDC006197]|uniref:hypothetical protein n=1 Tax=Streptomyces sp. NPDC006197 TaxID=3156685 RepID=UPI0033B21A07
MRHTWQLYFPPPTGVQPPDAGLGDVSPPPVVFEPPPVVPPVLPPGTGALVVLDGDGDECGDEDEGEDGDEDPVGLADDGVFASPSEGVAEADGLLVAVAPAPGAPESRIRPGSAPGLVGDCPPANCPCCGSPSRPTRAYVTPPPTSSRAA